MDEHLKHRLIGAAVLLLAAVIFVPMLLDDTGAHEPGITQTNIPLKPAAEFNSKIVPLDTDMPAPVVESNPPAPLAPAAAAREALAAAPASPTTPGARPPAPKVGVTAWVVQLGSFAAEQNAGALEKRLRDQGYNAFVEKLATDQGNAYRVRVGPELLRADADEIRDRLERDINLKGMVVRYP